MCNFVTANFRRLVRKIAVTAITFVTCNACNAKVWFQWCRKQPLQPLHVTLGLNFPYMKTGVQVPNGIGLGKCRYSVTGEIFEANLNVTLL